MKVSVIICTYNRCSLLKKAIASLKVQSLPAESYEIIVVDNNSTDATRQIVAEAAAGTSIPIRYILEPQQGLSAARNRGIREASGRIVAFIDDDAAAEPGWLRRLVAAFDRPDVACAGGKVLPLWESGEGGWPGWLSARLICFFSVITDDIPADRHYPSYPAGTNIAFRKEILSTTEGFDTQLGRTGSSLLSMEETELCVRIERAGFRIRYEPKAIVRHLVPESRLSREWVLERSQAQGASAAMLEKKIFPRWRVVGRSVLYLGIIAAAPILRAAGPERNRFFWKCQSELCSTYLVTAWRER